MEEFNWLEMLSFQQELHAFSRVLLAQQEKKILTASELELLSRLFLQPEENTPLALSRRSGMKKEAVSRCLKHLLEKDFLRKDPHPGDERSCLLSLTDSGRQALGACYAPLLRPLYALRRQMGTDFEELFRLIHEANRLMDSNSTL